MVVCRKGDRVFARSAMNRRSRIARAMLRSLTALSQRGNDEVGTMNDELECVLVVVRG